MYLECPICALAMAKNNLNSDYLAILKCGHMFYKRCTHQKWIQFRDDRSSCSICEAKTKEDNNTLERKFIFLGEEQILELLKSADESLKRKEAELEMLRAYIETLKENRKKKARVEEGYSRIKTKK